MAMTGSHVRPGVGMFDAFIINRIRREQRREQDRRLPLHIEAPRMPAGQSDERGDARSDDNQSRGTWVDDGWSDNSWTDTPRSDDSRGRRPNESGQIRRRGVVDIDFDI